jgi:2-dehydropantoate 2-reductase
MTMMNVTRRRASSATQGLPFMEPLHILGSGAIGLLFASCIRISFPSYPVTVLLKPHHESRLQKEGRKSFVEVCLMAQKRPRMVRIPAQLISETSTSSIRHVLLTTKAPDAATAVKSILPRLDKDSSRIIILCNGALAVKDEISQLLNNSLLLDGNNSNIKTTITLASTYHGAFRDIDGTDLYHVTHAGVGKTFVEHDVPLAQLWDQSHLVAASISSNEMTLLLWRKLAANCVINPITALLRCRNGAIVDQDLYIQMAPDIIQELANVAMHEDLQPDALTTFVNQVIQGTLDNKSSMYQDVLKKQPTEIDYLNGYIARLGKERNVPTPANQEMCDRIQALTESW